MNAFNDSGCYLDKEVIFEIIEFLNIYTDELLMKLICEANF